MKDVAGDASGSASSQGPVQDAAGVVSRQGGYSAGQVAAGDVTKVVAETLLTSDGLDPTEVAAATLLAGDGAVTPKSLAKEQHDDANLPSADDQEIRIGDAVEVHSLVGARDLNGLSGTVVGRQVCGARLQVNFAPHIGGREIKVGNLRKIPGRSSALAHHYKNELKIDYTLTAKDPKQHF